MSFRRFILQLLWVYAGLVFLSLLLALLGQPVPPILTPLSTSVCFVFALLHAGRRLGWQRAAAFLIIAFCIALIFESLGVATGYVYGPYHYTDSLGQKFLGLVPFLVPLAWFMMMYPSLVIADRLLPGQSYWKSVLLRRLAAAGLGGVIMTAWDLSLDPLMVASNHWVWDVKGSYFGIPLQNYWGWWLTAFIVLFIYQEVSCRLRPFQTVSALSDGYLVTSYLVTAGGSVVIDSFTHLGGPALVGLFAIFPWVMAGYLGVYHDENLPEDGRKEWIKYVGES
jgi:putative membrane protein